MGSPVTRFYKGAHDGAMAVVIPPLCSNKLPGPLWESHGCRDGGGGHLPRIDDQTDADQVRDCLCNQGDGKCQDRPVSGLEGHTGILSL